MRWREQCIVVGKHEGEVHVRQPSGDDRILLKCILKRGDTGRRVLPVYQQGTRTIQSVAVGDFSHVWLKTSISLLSALLASRR